MKTRRVHTCQLQLLLLPYQAAARKACRGGAGGRVASGRPSASRATAVELPPPLSPVPPLLPAGGMGAASGFAPAWSAAMAAAVVGRRPAAHTANAPARVPRLG